jgi:hypothetical protein
MVTMQVEHLEMFFIVDSAVVLMCVTKLESFCGGCFLWEQKISTRIGDWAASLIKSHRTQCHVLDRLLWEEALCSPGCSSTMIILE